MPWKDTRVMDERAKFVLAYVEGNWTMSELCRAFGISRKTGYKWVDRYEAGGVANLEDQSRARHTQAHRVTDEVRRLVVAARRQHPTWGPKKLRKAVGDQNPDLDLPSLTTVHTILDDAELIKRRRRRRRPLSGSQGQPGVQDRANKVWSVDFKGEFRLGNRTYCYPLTVCDSYSRMLLCCQAMPGLHWQPVQQQFQRLFRNYGLPYQIRSDNGSPFAGPGLGRLSRLSVWWLNLGIDLHRIQPGRPQQNGRHERMHRTLKAEATRPPSRTRLGQQRRFGLFQREYNQQRPHEGIDMQYPQDLYEPSERSYRESQHLDYDYPSHHEVRVVSSKGMIAWRQQRVFVSHALAGEKVSLVEVDDGRWRVRFRRVPLGIMDTRQRPFRITDITTPQGRAVK